MARPDSTVPVVTATVLLSIYSAAAAQTFVPPDLSIRAGDPQPFDGFGYGLAGEGANLLVGARGSDSTALNGGAIYAFSRVGASWQQVQKIVFPGAQQGDGIGEALAMAGAVGVAGAPRRGIGGSAFILRFDGGAWFPVTEVTDTSAGSGSEFGASVDCGADSVVIGAPSSSEGVGAFAGRVRVFRRDGVLWSSGEVLTAEFPDPGDRFGFAVAMDGGWLAVSAPGDDDGGVNAGAVWLYRESGGAFVLIEKLTPPGPSPANVECGFGQSICIDGSRLLVGAPRADLAGIDAGAVYRFNLGAKGASPVGVILPPGPAAACDFGFSVASLGQVAVIGAPGLTRDGQLSGGAFVCLDGATSDGVLTASTTGIGLVGARVALAGDSIIAAAPAMTVLTAGYAGQLIAIDRTRDCDQSGVPDGIEVAAGALIDGNQDGVPDACQCLPDLSGDGIVSGSDLALILGFWGTGGSATFDADITNDGIVNAEDLALVLGAWGPCPG